MMDTDSISERSIDTKGRHPDSPSTINSNQDISSHLTCDKEENHSLDSEPEEEGDHNSSKSEESSRRYDTDKEEEHESDNSSDVDHDTITSSDCDDQASDAHSHSLDEDLSYRSNYSEEGSSRRSVTSDEESVEQQGTLRSGQNIKSKDSIEREENYTGRYNTKIAQNDNEGGQSISNVTFNDATTLQMSNHIRGSDRILKKRLDAEADIDPASEFDDETRSSKTRHKYTASILLNDDHTYENISPRNVKIKEGKIPQQLGDYFATQGPVVEVDMIDQSFTSGLTTGDNYGGPSPNSVQDIPISYHKLGKREKEKQSHFPQLKDIPEEEKYQNRPHLNNTPQSSWPTQIPNINKEKKRSVIGRNQWCSSRIHKFFCQKGSMNNVCADCSVSLEYADSIYASFYMNPHVSKKKKKQKFKKTSDEKKRSFRRYKSSIEEIIDVIDSDSSSSDLELFDSDIKTVKAQSLIDFQQMSSLSIGIDGYEQESSPRLGKISMASNLSSSRSVSSSRSQVFLLDSENANNLEEKVSSTRKQRKHPVNNRVYHIANFKSLHSYHGVTGFSSKFIQPSKRKKTSSLHKRVPPTTFIQQHGVFICKDCAFAHNMLGRNITTVKSVYATTKWSDEEIDIMEKSGGNVYAKHILQRYIPDRLRDIFSLHDRSTIEERVMFIKAKYDLWTFMFPKSLLHKMSRWETLLQNDLSTKRKQRKIQSYLLPDRLIDYFCVVGATRSIKKSQKPVSVENSFSHSINIELQPKVWDCYPIPQNAYSDMALPRCLPNFAFPNGCRPSSKKKAPHFFTFVLTLEHTNAKVYGSALIVYEDIVYMDQILDCLHNESVVFQMDKKQIEEDLTSKQLKEERQKLFLPKALIILSHYPLVDLHRTFLQQIYLLSNTKSTPLPIERYISNFCSDVPLPPQGQVSIKFGYFNDSEGLNVHFCRPAKNNLPLVGCSFRPLFTSLSVSNILVVFGCLAYEMKVALCSKHTGLLTPVAEALRSTLYPFVWQGLYIPILPHSMTDVLQSPEPFLVGIHSRYLVEIAKSDRPTGVVFVDLDKDIVHLGFEERQAASIERRTPHLPEKEVDKLKSKLDQFGGLAYLPPSGGQKGRLTSGLGLETVLNSEREKYAYQTSMATGNDKKKAYLRDSFGSLRTGILAKVDEAYVNDEHLKAVYFPETTLGMGAKLVRESVSLNGKKKRKNNDNVFKRRSLLDSTLDEKGGFSTREIRQSFVRFFAVIFRNYDRFLFDQVDHDGYETNNLESLFDSMNFLRKVNIANNHAMNFVTSFITTRMFEQYIRERLGNPNLPEILFFDETIIVRKNLSKKNKLKGGLRKTPFLSDKSDWDLEPYSSPPPSTFNLPFMGRRYYKKKFPRLRADLYSEPRKMRKWQSAIIQRRINYSYVFYNDTLSKLFLTTPFSSVPPKDLQWALMVTAYRVPICLDMDINKKEDNEQFHRNEQNRLLKISMISDSAVNFAEQFTESARVTNIQLLKGIIKIQAFHRMHDIRDRYQYLLSMIIVLQAHFRDSLFRKKYGSTFKGVNAKAADIQRIYRGHATRMSFLLQKHSAMVIQHVLKCYFQRLYFLRLKNAAKQLSSYFRVRHIRYGFLLVRQLMASIQAQIRGYLKRKQISSLRRKRILAYRAQLFELWRRSATPLSYRAKFWKLFNKNSFLNLSLHEEELARVWEVLGIKVSVTTTVYDKCKQIHQVLEAKKQKESNMLVPIFPAEMPIKRGEKCKQKDFLKVSRIRLAAERQKLYSILKHMEIDTKNRVFKLFKLDESEERRKERIVKCLWEYHGLIKPSITFILNIYDEYGNLQNVMQHRGFMDVLIGKQQTNIPSSSVLRRFDLDVNSNKTYDIVKRCSKNMSTWVQLKYDERIQNDVVGSAKACLNALQVIDRGLIEKRVCVMKPRKESVSCRSHSRTSHIRTSTLYLKNADLHTKQKRLELAQTYIDQTPKWSDTSHKKGK